MKTLHFFVATLVGVLGQELCCFPPQWESPTGVLEGYYLPGSDTAGEVDGLDRVSFDYTNKKLLANVTMVNNGVPIKTTTLLDYNQGKMYQIVNDNCTSTNLEGEFPKNCVPDGANFTGTAYFGAGNNRLYVNTFRAEYYGAPLFVSLTKDECIPVSETVTLITPTIRVVLAVTYTGLTVGIKDFGVFKTPEKCTHVDITTPIVEGSTGGIIGRMKRGLL